MPDKPKNLPTYEDALEKLGPDAMSLFSDMVRPDQHEEREEDANLLSGPTREGTLTPEHERAVIEYLEKAKGRKLTPQERHLALEQERLL
jgi:hypothetical protein